MQTSEDYTKQKAPSKEMLQCFELTPMQLQHLERLSTLGQLTASVSHEINNPLSYIYCNLTILCEYFGVYKEVCYKYEDLIAKLQEKGLDCDKDLNAHIASIDKLKVEKDVEYICDDISTLIDETKKGLDYVKQIACRLKSYSRLDENTDANTDVNETIDSTIKMVWNEMKYKCEIKRDFGKVPRIKCNESQFTQIVSNVLINAAQAIEKWGVITIKTYAEDSKAVISIADTGQGISSENLPNLFKPFYTSKPKGVGTGLGLTIVQDIIKKQGGEITVHSEVEKGTTFLIHLPIRL